MKWAIGWFDESTIVLSSSDIGTQVWQLEEDHTITKLSDSLPKKFGEFGRRIKAAKYDR